MNLRGICLITENVTLLTEFYSAVLCVPVEGNATHAGVEMEGMHLTLFSAEGMDGMAPGSMRAAGRGTVTLDIEVEDVDAEYQRILTLGATVIKPPQTYAWGSRSMWFRDPDGNIVNFYQRIRQQE